MQNLFQTYFSDILYTVEESLCNFHKKYFGITPFTNFFRICPTSTETVS